MGNYFDVREQEISQMSKQYKKILVLITQKNADKNDTDTHLPHRA